MVLPIDGEGHRGEQALSGEGFLDVVEGDDAHGVAAERCEGTGAAGYHRPAEPGNVRRSGRACSRFAAREQPEEVPQLERRSRAGHPHRTAHHGVRPAAGVPVPPFVPSGARARVRSAAGRARAHALGAGHDSRRCGAPPQHPVAATGARDRRRGGARHRAVAAGRRRSAADRRRRPPARRASRHRRRAGGRRAVAGDGGALARGHQRPRAGRGGCPGRGALGGGGRREGDR